MTTMTVSLLAYPSLFDAEHVVSEIQSQIVPDESPARGHQPSPHRPIAKADLLQYIDFFIKAPCVTFRGRGPSSSFSTLTHDHAG